MHTPTETVKDQVAAKAREAKQAIARLASTVSDAIANGDIDGCPCVYASITASMAAVESVEGCTADNPSKEESIVDKLHTALSRATR